jgi:hypothetical protein
MESTETAFSPSELAGKETEVIFLATLKDDRKLLAAVDGDTFEEISRKFAA